MARSRPATRPFVHTVLLLSAAVWLVGTAATLGLLAASGHTPGIGSILGIGFAWALVATAQALVLSMWFSRTVAAPLGRITGVAERLADGDVDARAQVGIDSPFAHLAAALNRVAESFRSRSDAESARVSELTTLYQTSRALGSILDLDGLLGAVLDEALEVLEVDVGYVMLRDRATGVQVLRARRGADGVSGDELVDRSVTDWVARETRPLILNPGAAARRGTGIVQSTLCAPLSDSDGAIGAITMGSTDARDRFTADDVRLLSTIANHATVAIRNVELFASLREAYIGTVRSLAAAIDAKDAYTRGHSERVAEYASLVAERMGLPDEECLALELAAYLHDIGKIGIPEQILRKPGRLDDEESAVMKSHPIVGATILTPVEFPWPIMPAVRHHHEHFDGSGYPAGLRGPDIPLLARILTVADSFEAMVSDRPYRPGRPRKDAVREVVRCSGTQFDPDVVQAFVGIVEPGHAADIR